MSQDSIFEFGNVTYFYNSTLDFIIVGHANLTEFNENKVAIPNITDFNTIEIPNSIHGHLVKEIGSYSFCKCYYLKVVKINAHITQINDHAFYQCWNLTSINIPSTCEFIGQGAISSVIWVNDSTQLTAPGTLSVKFEPNATLKTIGKYGIERKDVIIITYCGSNQPNVSEDSLFYESTYSVVYSPVQIMWAGKNTIVDPSICLLLEEVKNIKCPTMQTNLHICSLAYMAMISLIPS